MNARIEKRTEKMLDMYEKERMTMREIAEKYGVSRQRVHQLIGDRVSKAHYGAADPEKRERAIRDANARLHAGETTLEWEARQLGLKPATLAQYFYRIGLKLPPRPQSPLHGTYYRYVRGCRCVPCREAMRTKREERKRRGPPEHGTASAYSNYGCRCIPCCEAGSKENRRYREQRKLRDRERMPDE